MPEILAPSKTITKNMPTFQWRPVDTASSYVLKVKDAFDPVLYTYKYASDVCTPVCVATPANTLPDGDYTFFITAKNGDLSGKPSEGAFTLDTGATPPPDASPRLMTDGNGLLAIELAAVFGPLHLSSEWKQAWADETVRGTSTAFGGYLAAGLFLTGEHRHHA